MVIKDDLWCIDTGKFGAECFMSISNEEKTLNKYEWDKLRVGQVCTGTARPGEGYSNIKNAIEKLCADSRFCTPEQKKAIESVGAKAEKALKAGEKAPPFAH